MLSNSSNGFDYNDIDEKMKRFRNFFVENKTYQELFTGYSTSHSKFQSFFLSRFSAQFRIIASYYM